MPRGALSSPVLEAGTAAIPAPTRPGRWPPRPRTGRQLLSRFGMIRARPAAGPLQTATDPRGAPRTAHVTPWTPTDRRERLSVAQNVLGSPGGPVSQRQPHGDPPWGGHA